MKFSDSIFVRVQITLPFSFSGSLTLEVRNVYILSAPVSPINVCLSGGFSPNPSSVPVPDWVDSSVADWIASETRDMEKAWGSADSRAAVAFVHIPPHAIQVLQSTLDPEKNPGMNGNFPYFRSGSGLKLKYIADLLGDGSVQDSSANKVFWDALNANVKNLHAVISGHGRSLVCL